VDRPTARRLAAVALTGTLVACAARTPGPGDARPDLDAVPLADEDAALEAFDTVYAVLTHPRCKNCHPAGDRPLQTERSRPHVMNVRRGADGRGVPGMRCASCHGKQNQVGAHMPPGVETEWLLAPRRLAFAGKSERELAEALRDEEVTHMTHEELLHHMEEDPLVLWGWEPGDGREPVDAPHADVVAALRTWLDAGAPLPPAASDEDAEEPR